MLRSTLVSAGLGLLLATAAAPTLAAPIFSDDFEGNLSKWAIIGSGVTVNDPLVSGNRALSFTGLGSGGDIFTSTTLAGGTYHLVFDMLGTCTSGNCGAWIGIDDALGEHWLVGDNSYTPVGQVILNNGSWQHVDITFTASGSFRLKAEDYIGSGGAAGDVYFDNVCIGVDGTCSNTVPEPYSLALVAMGLLLMAGSRRAFD